MNSKRKKILIASIIIYSIIAILLNWYTPFLKESNSFYFYYILPFAQLAVVAFLSKHFLTPALYLGGFILFNGFGDIIQDYLSYPPFEFLNLLFYFFSLVFLYLALKVNGSYIVTKGQLRDSLIYLSVIYPVGIVLFFVLPFANDAEVAVILLISFMAAIIFAAVFYVKLPVLNSTILKIGIFVLTLVYLIAGLRTYTFKAPILESLFLYLDYLGPALIIIGHLDFKRKV